MEMKVTLKVETTKIEGGVMVVLAGCLRLQWSRVGPIYMLKA